MIDYKKLREDLRFHADFFEKNNEKFVLWKIGKLFAESADAIEELQAENERLALCKHNCKIECLLKQYNEIVEENERLKKQLEAAVKDIPRDCITCAFDDMGTEKTYHPCWDCSTEKSGWQWRGEEGKA